MISNRESARRSRRRKLEHVECLTDQINQLKAENYALLDQLRGVERQCCEVLVENNRLRQDRDMLNHQLQMGNCGKTERPLSLQYMEEEYQAKRGRPGTP